MDRVDDEQFNKFVELYEEGLTYYHQNNLERAYEFFTKAHQIKTTFVLLAKMIIIARKLNYPETPDLVFEQIELYPNSRDTIRNLRFVKKTVSPDEFAEIEKQIATAPIDLNEYYTAGCLLYKLKVLIRLGEYTLAEKINYYILKHQEMIETEKEKQKYLYYSSFLQLKDYSAEELISYLKSQQGDIPSKLIFDLLYKLCYDDKIDYLNSQLEKIDNEIIKNEMLNYLQLKLEAKEEI